MSAGKARFEPPKPRVNIPPLGPDYRAMYFDLMRTHEALVKQVDAVRELQNKIACHAQQDREEGLPAAALLTQIANDINRALEDQ